MTTAIDLSEKYPDLANRLRRVIEVNTPERGRFRVLHELSGLSPEVWKSFWYGRQRPSEQMFNFVFSTWPEMAFWTATGLSDVRYGHLTPAGAQLIEEHELRPMPFTRAYLLAGINVLKCRQQGIEPPLADVAQLGRLGVLRDHEVQSRERSEDADWTIRLATVVDGIPKDDGRHLVAKLLEALQQERGWSDQGMADTLGMALEDYLRAKDGAVDLLSDKQRWMIFDRWGYDKVRDALLAILPQQWAQRVRDLDIQRGKR